MKKHIFYASIVILLIFILLFKPSDDGKVYYENEPILMDVEITGAIKKPGSYKVHQGMTLAYLINLSGGLLESADISQMTLGAFISQTSYFIPNYEVSISPIIQRINLNTASYNELILVPNITENRALEILVYKKEIGQFTTVEELLNVKGIGVATFEKIKIYFYI